ncbi:hypothetical protein V389_01930, partial [Staphylococcus aureus T35596]|uniref:YfbR-like 5'-deoxynucleotidase n=1 Tax=Staphylococcus aureus TaxID=1280 RepID=UPI00044A2251
MGVHQYFKRLSDMERLIRLPGKFKYFEHNVAAHSFKVTKIAQYLATVEEYLNFPGNLISLSISDNL